MIRRLALILPLTGFAILLGTLVVLACQPDPNAPPQLRVIILPCASPKSLVTWLEMEQTTRENAKYDFSYPHKSPPDFPLAFYAGSERAENLIANRPHAGKLEWGPAALDTPYEVSWRGAGEVHVRLPDDATEAQITEWKAELERCDPGATVIVNRQSSTSPMSDASAETPH